MITDDSPSDPRPEVTGRQIVTFTEDSTPAEREEALRSISGVDDIATSSEFGQESVGPEQIENADATIFERLGVAVLDASGAQLESLETTAAESSVIIAVEPEHVVYALTVASPATDTHLSDNGRATWGLQATRALNSAFDGSGVRVAVLDTGFDLNHPDFAGRPITHRSFVPGQSVQDGHGHGTHCVGTSCGPREASKLRRGYGVAPGAAIHVGKVLSNEGSGVDSGIIAGIEWALANGCSVISMSLGADVATPVAAYEQIGRRALAAGSLIIAAAGNNARRPGRPGFVGSPANSPSIMAVAAVASDLRIASFSARSTGVAGGAVDIAGPGVAVFSSWPPPENYLSINGTSMATPHVAGVAALIVQATGKRGSELWKALTTTAEPLNLPAVDVGAGLAVAP